MNVDLNKKVIPSEDVLFQEVDGETVLLDLKSEHYFGLNAVGTRVWQLIQDNEELNKVFELLLDEYDVEPSQLENDLSKIVSELVHEGLAYFKT